MIDDLRVSSEIAIAGLDMLMHELYKLSGKSLREAIVYFQVIEKFLFIGFLPGIAQ
jgi:hypothetical protein